MSAQTIGEIGEFGLIDEITKGLPTPAQVSVGVGDDCAVFEPLGQVAVSTDAMIEDVHFRRAWSGPHDVGRKAVASTIADAEAMGARPIGVVISLSAPADTPVEWVREFASGVRAECELAGAALLGGDTSKGAHIGIVTTVLADLEGRVPILRSGAQPGDLVAYIGRLGMAAAGVAVLGRGFRSPGAVVRAHRVPEPPYGQGIVAANSGATAMIDCSDGLLADLGHIADASGVSIDVDPDSLDVHEAQKTVAAAIGAAFLIQGWVTSDQVNAWLKVLESLLDLITVIAPILALKFLTPDGVPAVPDEDDDDGA